MKSRAMIAGSMGLTDNGINSLGGYTYAKNKR
jgi:hypothetical protein